MQLDSQKDHFAAPLLNCIKLGRIETVYCDCVSLSQKPKLLRKFEIGVINGHYPKKKGLRRRPAAPPPLTRRRRPLVLSLRGNTGHEG
jgi:hypothetical protein